MPEVIPTPSGPDPIEGAVRLSDGSQLAYAEYGDSHGTPLIHFHGHPGSRLEAGILHEAALDMSVRLIGVDRPGMGHSDPQPHRRLVDWPLDVAELADSLGLEEFAVQGISGDGPYAATVARAMPDRLTAVSSISGAGPAGLGSGDEELAVNRLQRRLARHAPFLLNVAFRSMARSMRSRMQAKGPIALARAALAGLPLVDQNALAEQRLAERYGLALHEAFRQGGNGAAREVRLLSSPWGFEISEIDHPNLHVWHGHLDRNVTIVTGRAVAAEIPGANPHFHEDEGHISIATNRAREILRVVPQLKRSSATRDPASRLRRQTRDDRGSDAGSARGRIVRVTRLDGETAERPLQNGT